MNQSKLEQMLIDVVCQLQQISGRDYADVGIQTKPVEDVPGFDSLNAVEATVEIICSLNVDLEFNNVFVKGEKILTIREAATRLLNHLPK
ncbi:hypothetical protein MTYM_00477 [Methylococcales bacterium]|nr:hypothetical protein MTYM_00477 [Methylococcales bacterium]